ncbi:LysR family transcriptional regulator [Kangiella profundi]|uniref:LysR family transcriptional regulator n=1 Tax=Kangiella profundi TaxID=1561924 RepID=A0A2K9AVS8_9GAMM|nr:LysR family transcriptional regulator [Kangiella profundi]AUD79211.1 LysR family transcriptional regulator [Kangiella profundi]GGF00562.1 LysR family transcriptional regulator [Kangiella profundi]
MQTENIRSMDMNLLVLLDVLLEEKHISNAADRLHMSQPAVSRSLQRLREMLADPLLVRVGNGYQLTDKAAELQPKLKSWLADFMCMIQPEKFEPANAKGEISIMSMDLEMSLFMPNLWQDLQAQAPNVALRSFNIRPDGISLLEQGDIDFLVSEEDKSLESTKYHNFHLIQHDFVLVMSKSHHLAKKKDIGLDEYLQQRHGLVTVTGKGRPFIDRTLEKQGYSRKIALYVPTFHLALDICSRTDLMFSMPRLVAEKEGERYGVVMKEMPLKLPKLDIYLYWHERQHQTALHKWFRTLMRESFEQTRKGISAHSVISPSS